MSENSIEFSLSNSEQRDSWLNSSHQTLDADNFCKNKKLLYIKEYKELLEPTLDYISPFFTKISENKTWAKGP